MKMEPFVLLGLFAQFYSMFASQLAIFPLERSVLTNGESGVPRPQKKSHPKCLQNKGRRHNGLAEIGPNML